MATTDKASQRQDKSKSNRRLNKHATTYKDNKPYAKHHSIVLGDKIFLKQQSTKSRPPFDPSPYQVVSINGHQITATRDDRTVTRNAQKWKFYRTPERLETEERIENKRTLFDELELAHLREQHPQVVLPKPVSPP